METIRFSDQIPYEPAGHYGVVNRLLAGRGAGNLEAVSVWHGLLDEEGGAEMHSHEQSVQIYLLVAGTIVVTSSDESTELSAGDAVIIPAGEPHKLQNSGPGPASLYVVSSPALR